MLLYKKHKSTNEIIYNKARVTPIEDKIHNTWLRWLDSVTRKPIEALVGRMNGMEQVFSEKR